MKGGEVTELFDIAGLKVRMNCKNGMLFERSRAYLSDNQDGEADFTVSVPDDILKRKSELLPQLTADECHYVYMGEAFYYKLLNFNGLLLHASCIEKDGFAYLFSAKSGVGKSTHTHLWMEKFPDVRMINDDKPAIRFINGKYYACGTPFSGKNDESANLKVPIRAIVFLERDTENSISRISPQSAIPLFLAQTVRPSRKDTMDKLLTALDGVLKNIPVYKLKCNISEEAVMTSYLGIKNDLSNGEIRNEN